MTYTVGACWCDQPTCFRRNKAVCDEGCCLAGSDPTVPFPSEGSVGYPRPMFEIINPNEKLGAGCELGVCSNVDHGGQMRLSYTPRALEDIERTQREEERAFFRIFRRRYADLLEAIPT